MKNNVIEVNPRSKSLHSKGNQIYQSTNPKIKIIEQSNLNYYNQFQCQNQQKPQAQFIEQQMPKTERQYNNRNNVIKLFDKQQTTYMPKKQEIKNIFQPFYQPFINQNKSIQFKVDKINQVEMKNRSISEHNQPIQNIQNYQQNHSFQVQQQIRISNSNQNQQNQNYKQGYYKSGNKVQVNLDSQIIKESEINMLDSQIIEIQIKCHYCQQNVNETKYFLKCQHVYHGNCLKSIIEQQIMNAQQSPQLYCLCNIRIPRIPFIDRSFNKIYQDKLYNKQLQFIYQNNRNKFQYCQNCTFFWIKDQYQNNNVLKCCMC